MVIRYAIAALAGLLSLSGPAAAQQRVVVPDGVVVAVPARGVPVATPRPAPAAPKPRPARLAPLPAADPMPTLPPAVALVPLAAAAALAATLSGGNGGGVSAPVRTR